MPDATPPETTTTAEESVGKSTAGVWPLLFTGLLGTTITMLVVAYFVELPLCVTQLIMAGDRMGWLDEGLMFLALVGRMLVICLPAILIAAGLGRRGHRRWAWILLTLWPAGIAFYLLANVFTYNFTGNQVDLYVHYLFEPATWQLAGTGHVRTYLLMAAGFFAGALIFQFISLRLAAMIVSLTSWTASRRRWGRWARPLHPAMLATCAMVALALTFPAQLLAHDPGVFYTVQRSIPLDFWFAQKHYTYPKEVKAFQAAFLPKIAASAARFCRSVNVHGDTNTPMPTLDFPHGRKPNVVLILTESTRSDVLDPAFMPRMDALAHQGLWLRDHYSGSNCSQLGLFSLFYGRVPVRYRATMDASDTRPLLDMMKKAGYETWYLSSIDDTHFEYIGQQLYPPHVDHMELTEKRFGRQWDKGDAAIAARLPRILAHAKKPVFATIFFKSSHVPYLCPPSAVRFKSKEDLPTHVASGLFHRDGRIVYWSRLVKYLNALGNLDNIMADMIRQCDDGNTIFIYVGDHGESFGEDGAIFHTSRASDAQTRTPAFILGPGVPRRQITDMTSHADILPTLAHLLTEHHVAIPGVHGRDLLDGPPKEDAVFIRPLHAMLPPDFDESTTEPLLLVRPQGQMLFALHIGGPIEKPAPDGGDALSLELLGFTDHQGQLHRDRAPSAKAAQAWADAFNAVVARTVPRK